MSSLFTLPEQTPLVSGALQPGAKLYFFQTGTTTPQNTYQDNARATPHANPVVADADGTFPAIYLDPTLPDYRARLTTSADVQLEQWDGVPSNQNTQQSVRLESTNPFVFLYDTDGTSGSRKYRVRAAGAAFEVQASNEAENVFTTILRYEGGILYSNETEVAVTTSGSFTGELTGMSTTITGTVRYRTLNNVAYVWITAGITGTSDDSEMSMTDLPAAITPASTKVCACAVTDNGNSEMAALAIVGVGGTIRFDPAKTDLVANYVQHSLSGFTPSGTKGLQGGWLIAYPLL